MRRRVFLGPLREQSLGAGPRGCLPDLPCPGLLLLRVPLAHKLPWEVSSPALLPQLPPQSSPSQTFPCEWLLLLPGADHTSRIPAEMQWGVCLGPCVPPGVEGLPAEEAYSAGPANGDGVHWHGKPPPHPGQELEPG